MRKICKGECKEPKPLTDYYFNENHRSYFGICKVCTNKNAKTKRVPTPRAEPKPMCKCGEDDPDNFSNNKAHATGKQYKCKKCYLAYQRKYHSTTVHKIDDGREKRRDAIRSKFKMWCLSGVFR